MSSNAYILVQVLTFCMTFGKKKALKTYLEKKKSHKSESFSSTVHKLMYIYICVYAVGLTSAEIKTLTTDAIEGLAAEVIAELPVPVFAVSVHH